MPAPIAGLSPEQLCVIIEARAGASDAALRVAEEHAAWLVEQPEWVLSEVLLSPDLAPHILAQLPTKEHAAKGTCRAWRCGWKEMLAAGRRPRLLVVGEDISSMERYDPAENVWEREAVAPMPTTRECHRLRLDILDGKLYAVGGMDADNASTNLVERYDLATKAWDVVAPMATPRENHAMAVLDGKLYAAGGENVDGQENLNSVERYDPATNAWEEVAPMVRSRDLFSLAVLEGKLYAVGGFDAGRCVERYDPATNAWEEVAPMAEARSDHAVAVLNGKLYAVGGDGGVFGGDILSSVERYDPAANSWEAVAPVAAGRSNHGVAVLDGKLYVVGGLSRDRDVADWHPASLRWLSSVERYDPALDAWEAVAPMAARRVCLSLAV